MAVTVNGSHFVCDSAETDASLKAAIDANPTLGMYETGAAIFRSRSLSIPAGKSLTLNDYTNLVFDDANGYRIDLAGKLDFKFGGGITYNGNVQHTFFNGELHGENITYTLNGTVANGRSDFFSPNTSSSSTLKNLRLVYGKGASGYSYFTHLEALAGRIDGLTLINNLQVSGTIFVQFGNGAYPGVVLPSPVSKFGITASLQVYIARVGGNSRLPRISIPGQSLTILGDSTGSGEFVDESWPDIGAGQYGAIQPGSSNINNTVVARKLTFVPGSLFDATDSIFVRITDSQATPGVYLDGAITSASGTEIQWASYSRNPDVQTDFGAIKLVARRWNMVEQVRTYNITKTANGAVFKWVSDMGQTPFTYSALNVLDIYATTKRTSLVGIAFNPTAKTVTFSQAMTWDDAHDFAKFYLTQNRNVANFVEPSAGIWVLTGGWAVVGHSVVTPGAKLKGVIDANNAGQITITGPAATDTVEMRKASDNSLISSRTGAGAFAVSPANVGVSVYFERKVGTVLVMSTQTTPVTLSTVNEDVPMFAGPQVAVANVDGMAKEATLQALATTNQTEHDATQAAIAAIPPVNLTPVLTAVDALPTLAEMEGSWKLTNGGLIDLGTFAYWDDPANTNTVFAAAIDYALLNDTNFAGITASIKFGSELLACTVQDYGASGGLYITATVSQYANLDAQPTLIIRKSGAVIARANFIPGGPTMRDIEASSVLAKEATVASRASQTSVNAIPTNPLLTTDTRLNNLDAAISTRSTLTAPQVRSELATELGRIDVATSTRLAASAYVAPTTAPTATENAAAVRTNLATELARIDATVSSRLPTASYVAPTTPPTSAQNASAVRTELTTELARIDVATSTRLAAASYVAPTTPPTVVQIRQEMDTNSTRLINLDAAVSTRATQTSVNAIPTNPLLTNDARVNNLDAAVSSRLAASAYIAAPTLASIRADIERTGGMLDVLPTLAEMTASTLAKQSDLTGLATAANVTAAQTFIVTEINANEVKIDAVKADTAAIKLKTDALTNAPTAEAIRIEMEKSGAKLDVASQDIELIKALTL